MGGDEDDAWQVKCVDGDGDGGQDAFSATKLILRARVLAAASDCLRFALAVRLPSNEAEECQASVRGDSGHNGSKSSSPPSIFKITL